MLDRAVENVTVKRTPERMTRLPWKMQELDSVLLLRITAKLCFCEGSAVFSVAGNRPEGLGGIHPISPRQQFSLLQQRRIGNPSTATTWK